MAGFPDGRFRSIVARCVFAMAALLALLIIFPLDSGLVGPLFLLCNLGVLVSLWLRYRRETAGVERQQIKWAVLGFASSLALLLPVQISSLLYLLEGEGSLPYLVNAVLVPLALMLVPAGLLVSLLRYRLYDADQVISRSAGYAVLTLLLGATFAASAEGLEYFFENSLGQQESALPGAIAAALAVVLITPLNERIRSWAERRFQKGLIRLRRDLPECVGDLRETSGREPLLAETLERISSAVRASRSAVVVEGKPVAVREVSAEAVATWAAQDRVATATEALDCDRSDTLFPMRVPLRVRHGGGEPLGWILLGPRPDGSFYGSDEREALAEVADPVARALQVVMLREEREAAQESRLQAIEEKLAEALRGIAGANARPAA